MEENEIKEEKKKSWLEKIDDKAEAKGSTVKTLWQIAKFTIICTFTTGIQLLLVNVLLLWMKVWKAPLPSFLEAIFDPR
jgi:hypothetical protein